MNVSEFDASKELPSMRVYWQVALPVTVFVFLILWFLRILSRMHSMEKIGDKIHKIEDAIISWTTKGLGSRRQRSLVQEQQVRNELVLNTREGVEVDGKKMVVTIASRVTTDSANGGGDPQVVSTSLMEQGGQPILANRRSTWINFRK